MRSKRDFWSDNDQDTVCLPCGLKRHLIGDKMMVFDTQASRYALLFCLEGVTELK